MLSEQTIINELIASKNQRGAFVQSLVEEFGTSLSLKNIEAALLALVVQTISDERSLFKRRLQDLLKKGTPSDEETIEAMELYTCSIDNAVCYLFLDDPIITSRIDEVYQNPALIGFDGFSFSGFHHIGVNYAMYWYSITGLQADPCLCSKLNHIHANAIQETLSEIDQQSGASWKISQRVETGYRNQRASWPYWVAVLILGLLAVCIIYFANE